MNMSWNGKSPRAGARAALVTLTAIVAFVAGSGLAQAQDNKWGFGSDVGFQSGTVNGTVFSLGFNLDYYLDPAFSFGPMLLLAPTGDLTQIAIAGVARYHYRIRSLNVVPFAGLGLVHADLNRGSGPGSIDRNDTSHFIPLGVTLEYQLAPKLALASTFMFNLHSLNLSPELQRDTNSVALMFGMRFGP